MDWRVVNRVYGIYAKRIQSLAAMMLEPIKSMDTPDDIVRFVRTFAHNQQFNRYCDAFSREMITMVNRWQCQTWREAAAHYSIGRFLYNALIQEMNNGVTGLEIARLIHENAALITTLPIRIAEQMTVMVRARTFEGVRASDIAAEIGTMFLEKTKANAVLIARTEVSKAQTALIRARAETIGLEWYIWRTSKDERVRSAHDHMDGVLVRWSDPPNPEALDPKKKAQPYGKYHAGNTFNCRCYPEPVIDFDILDFTGKVHINNSIKSMTKAKFKKLMDD